MNLHETYHRGLYLILIMASVVMIVLGTTTYILYDVAFQEERQRLIETAQSRARMMEAIANHHKNERDVVENVLVQVREAHEKFAGFGDTGEFVLARQENHQIIFLLSHRHHDLSNPHPVPIKSHEAEPMRLALQGKSGSIVGLDYRGVRVLAAYEPVNNLGLGVVAKIDMKEVQSPFFFAAWIATGIALLLIFMGAWIFQRITKPILATINNINGILPICAWCSNQIKNDDGEWVKLESYLEGRTDAIFSHGICPECTKKQT